MKIKYFTILALSFILSSCATTINTGISFGETNTAAQAIKNIPPTKAPNKHQVLTLGVFHFDRSMDGSDVVAKNHLDISSNENQKQINEIVEALVKFSPAKIAIEWKPNKQEYIDKLYQEYLNGTYELGKNESFQIGFRVAKRLGHKKLYCVDTNPSVPESLNEIDDLEAYAEDLGHAKLWHAYDEVNKTYLNYMDNIQNELYVIDYLTLMNSPENQLRRKQLWTTGLINVGHDNSYIGADLLGRWYKRNSRIYASSKNIIQNKNENLLVIYGIAHKWILDELFESHPEFSVVQLSDMMEN